MQFEIKLDETDGQIIFSIESNGYFNEIAIGTSIFRKQIFTDGSFDDFIEALELTKNHTLTVANCNMESIKNKFIIENGKFIVITGVYTDFSGESGIEPSIHGVHHFDQKIVIALMQDDNLNKLLNVFSILKMFQPQIDENEDNENNKDDEEDEEDEEFNPDDFDYDNYD